mmetsp:Transcript_24185/g.43641  ORF Transcript_24185/g.43641 Transcript_24185/m.43641 type:complete len:232 (-) Transcript_24185:1126-1821(-)
MLQQLQPLQRSHREEIDGAVGGLAEVVGRDTSVRVRVQGPTTVGAQLHHLAPAVLGPLLRMAGHDADALPAQALVHEPSVAAFPPVARTHLQVEACWPPVEVICRNKPVLGVHGRKGERRRRIVKHCPAGGIHSRGGWAAGAQLLQRVERLPPGLKGSLERRLVVQDALHQGNRDYRPPNRFAVFIHVPCEAFSVLEAGDLLQAKLAVPVADGQRAGEMQLHWDRIIPPSK